MIEKLLKNYTIIPPELYIKRQADWQLSKNIQEMGRPGYILVSRQMGKTNLLLNAKRENESDELKFVYVDLSNVLDTPADCFRNMINIAINSDKAFSGAIDTINTIRKEKQPASNEHEKELLALLRNYNGKVVIVLDEIDALTSTNYSDTIFAQIRSTYFAGRTNYPEFNRLTYILSGVVEPSNLIRDKNKSPFNIGEKIYLDDFIYEEYLNFIAKLPNMFEMICSSKIFELTNGHPRMTWDICSALEDIYISRGNIVDNDIDVVVRRLYLDNFDTAPVDHIRDLAQKNLEIRRAIRDILSGNFALSESVKRKLYLAGITKSDISSAEIKIKNRIISEALAISWIDNIDKANIDLLSLANEQNNLGNYSEAIRYYLDYINNYGVINEELQNAIYYKIGFCNSKIGDYETAITYYNKCAFDKDTEPANYFNNLLDTGISYYHLERHENGIACFKEIISDSKPSLVKIHAKLNYAGSIMATDFDANKGEALSLYHQILDEVSDIDFQDLNQLNNTKVLCCSNIGYIYSHSEEIDKAKEFYHRAININVPKYIPAVYLRLFSIENDTKLNNELVIKCIRAIIDNKLRLDDDSPETTISFSNYTLSKILIYAYTHVPGEAFNEIAEYSLRKIYSRYQSMYELILGLANFAKSTYKYHVSINLYEDVLNIISNETIDKELSSKVYMEIYRSLGIIKAYLKQKYEADYQQYLKYFVNSAAVVNDDDFKIFTMYTIKLRNEKKYETALTNLNIILKNYDLSLDELKPNYVGLLFLKSQINDTLKRKREAYLMAKEVLCLVKAYDQSKTNAVTMQEVDIIKSESERIFSKNSISEPVTSIKHGRNDPCPCGSGKKYKKCCGK